MRAITQDTQLFEIVSRNPLDSGPSPAKNIVTTVKLKKSQLKLNKYFLFFKNSENQTDYLKYYWESHRILIRTSAFVGKL